MVNLNTKSQVLNILKYEHDFLKSLQITIYKNEHFVAAFHNMLLGATACDVFSGHRSRKGLGPGIILSLLRMV